uniref:Sin3 C-terminal domain-containing protein n=1 Tax=Euplotes harpa TaxID=151035 RepID=A0A7S3J495_9SPIT|mmetsp:Transcript_19125/g.22065  ORF Transcript_19125/g.22065 Transcript_19125/m.22065 type:complete len:373 (+) Transcript_19125:695-1813(+)
MNTNTEDRRSVEEIAEQAEFLPYFTNDYSVLFGSPNYFVFLRCFYTMYERIRLAHKIIADKVAIDFKEKKEEILHCYRSYIRAKERDNEIRKYGCKDPSEINANANENQLNFDDVDENVIKAAVTNHRLAILLGISITKFKNKLDGATFEDLVRTFLGIKSFFFFTFDKLIHTTFKAFQALLNDEVLKSKSFKLFLKHCRVNNRQRETMYLNDYKLKLNELNSSGGFTARLLYSPKSKCLSINFFSVPRPYTSSSLTEEFRTYKEKYVASGQNEKLYSGDLPLPSSNVFLKRNKKAVMDAMNGHVVLTQNMSNSFSVNCLKLRYREHQTDIVQRFRQKSQLEVKKEASKEPGESNNEGEVNVGENKRFKESE